MEQDIDIAIIGMSLNFPMAKNKQEFWDNLLNSRFDVGEFPRDRQKMEEGFVEGISGCFLDNIKDFDAEFFDISDDEALYMDPQQKMMLSLCYELFEDSQMIDLVKREKNIGVYIGASENLYYDAIFTKTQKDKSYADVPKHTLTGNIVNMLAGRISHHFDLHGPSLVLDSACSSSFSALNYAVQDLRAGAIEYAIVGGMNLYHSSYIPFLCKQAGIVSPSGKCLVFSSKADGTIPGEGAGMVMLTRADVEKCQKHRVYSLIKAIGLNNDGRTLGIMSPNPRSQYSLIKSVYENNNIDPSTIQYVEAHGTGTLIGDPIEVHSLNKYFQTRTDEKQFCGIGSVKSNIGHLLSAAGIAGLLKTVLSLWHKKQVPTLHLEEVNNKIIFSKTAFYPVAKVTEWPEGGNTPRRAGINNFGIGGTNGHAVLEEYIPDVQSESCYVPPVLLFPFSTKSQQVFDELQSEIKLTLDNVDISELKDLSLSQILCRDHFKYRGMYYCHSSEINSEFVIKEIPPRQDQQMKKVHIHIGSNWHITPGYGEELYNNFPLFREEADLFCSSLEHEIFKNSGIKEILFSNSMMAESNGARVLKQQWAQDVSSFILINSMINFLRKIGVRAHSYSGEGIGLLIALMLSSKLTFNDVIDILIRRVDHLRLNRDADYPVYEISQKRNRIKLISSVIADETEALNTELITTVFSGKFSREFHDELNATGAETLFFSADSAHDDDFQIDEGRDFFTSGKNTLTEDIFKMIGEMYISGQRIDWYKLLGNHSYKYIELPLYKSNNKEFWLG